MKKVSLTARLLPGLWRRGKKAAVCLAFAAALASVPGTARADVIWEPDDPFYTEKCMGEAGRNEFVLNERNYFTNGKLGYLYVTDDPEKETIADALENGVRVFVSFTYVNGEGEEWGVIQYERGEDGQISPSYRYGEDDSVKTGWSRMEELSLIYDSEEFKKDHQGEIKNNDGTVEIQLEPGEELQYWSYPGSGNIIGNAPDGDKPAIAEIYTDEDGEQWGYVNYHYGIRDVWVCITRPSAVDLPVRAPSPQEQVAPAEIPQNLPETMDDALGEKHVGKEGTTRPRASTPAVIMTVIGLVALAAGSSIGIIAFIYKKKREEAEEESGSE